MTAQKRAPRIQVDLLCVDTPMPSGNVYPREVVEAAMLDFKKKIVSGTALGAFAPADLAKGVRIAEVSHMVTSVFLKDDVLVAELEILPTPQGEVLLEWLKAQRPIKAAPRSVGSFEEGGQEDYMIRELEIIAVDIWPGDDEDESENEDSDP